jgi:hypothetical protein
VVNATPRPLYPRKRPGTHYSWVRPGVGLDVCIKPRPHRDSIPGPPRPQQVTIPTELSRPNVTNKPSVGFAPNSSKLRFAPNSSQLPFTPNSSQLPFAPNSSKLRFAPNSSQLPFALNSSQLPFHSPSVLAQSVHRTLDILWI